MRRLFIHMYHGGDDRLLGLIPLDEAKRLLEVRPDLFIFLTLSEIARRISALSSEVRDNGMKSFKPQSINVFLLNAGFLEEVETSAGKKTKRPTETGRALGILMDSRTGPNGSYTVVVYNREAQQFVIDNIDAVLTIDRR